MAFLQLYCCMDLTAATRAEGGLVLTPAEEHLDDTPLYLPYFRRLSFTILSIHPVYISDQCNIMNNRSEAV